MSLFLISFKSAVLDQPTVDRGGVSRGRYVGVAVGCCLFALQRHYNGTSVAKHFFSIVASIRIGRDIFCLPYEGALVEDPPKEVTQSNSANPKWLNQGPSKHQEVCFNPVMKMKTFIAIFWDLLKSL